MAVTFAIHWITYMANTYFQFKQFTINQGQCAMKVSTEACLLGAWVPDTEPNRILDIGSGTGLLALMLAQRINSPIDALELDEQAANQASQNVLESPWADRIHLINENVFEWAQTTDQSYDLIISNPPFFTNSLKSEASQKNLAKHDTSDFNKANLVAVLKKMLSEKGKAYILYPELESEQFKKEAKNIGLFCEPALVISNQPNGPTFRIVSMISKHLCQQECHELSIREGQAYSKEFEKMLSPYYLR